jgi:hypothetical protein
MHACNRLWRFQLERRESVHLTNMITILDKRQARPTSPCCPLPTVYYPLPTAHSPVLTHIPVLPTTHYPVLPATP